MPPQSTTNPLAVLTARLQSSGRPLPIAAPGTRRDGGAGECAEIAALVLPDLILLLSAQVAAGLLHSRFAPVILVDTFGGDKIDGFMAACRSERPERRVSVAVLDAMQGVLHSARPRHGLFSRTDR